MNDEQRADLEKAVNAPFLDDFPENTLRIRRNLLAVSSIALFYELGGLGVDPDTTFLGVKLTGLTPAHINIGLSILVGYFLVHFFCNSVAHVHEYLLRATVAKMPLKALAARPNVYDGEMERSEITPDESRQSTLFTWFDQYRDVINYITTRAREVFQETDDENNPDLQSIKNSLKAIEKELPRMDVLGIRLGRFGGSFQSFLKQQSARWLILEWGLPIFVGAAAFGAAAFDVEAVGVLVCGVVAVGVAALLAMWFCK